jgi:SPP1 gp7 family putative phage head morphogenesis protein
VRIDLDIKQIDTLIRRIWTGQLSLFNLPVSLYTEIAVIMETGVFTGYGATLTAFDIQSPDYGTLKALRDNVYFFSAAKTFQEVKAMQSFIFTADGFKRSFRDFKKDAIQVFDRFNDAWLETEYNTAIAASQSASEWAAIEKDKDIFPLLRYVTQQDEVVREDHKPLNGLVFPVDDPFWRNHMPPNGFNCRCTVEQLEPDESKVTELTKELAGEIDDSTPELFRVNFAKDEIIFKEQGKGRHPYFNVADKYKVLKDNHFNLPRPR